MGGGARLRETASAKAGIAEWIELIEGQKRSRQDRD
jgi:hypothetical protein